MWCWASTTPSYAGFRLLTTGRSARPPQIPAAKQPLLRYASLPRRQEGGDALTGRRSLRNPLTDRGLGNTACWKRVVHHKDFVIERIDVAPVVHRHLGGVDSHIGAKRVRSVLIRLVNIQTVHRTAGREHVNEAAKFDGDVQIEGIGAACCTEIQKIRLRLIREMTNGIAKCIHSVNTIVPGFEKENYAIGCDGSGRGTVQ